MTASDPASAAVRHKPIGEELLSVTGLVKHFPIRRGLLQRQVAAVQAVDGLDFSVREGETLSLVGESGCGKSTTGRLVTRLEEPTAGKIVFEGRDITHLGDGAMRPLRKDVQMIFQDPYSSLNPRHTVGKIVGAPFQLQNVEPEGGVKKTVQELLELVGLMMASASAWTASRSWPFRVSADRRTLRSSPSSRAS
jgi:ABC-type oligopeptide transport system ATPase subunit